MINHIWWWSHHEYMYIIYICDVLDAAHWGLLHWKPQGQSDCSPNPAAFYMRRGITPGFCARDHVHGPNFQKVVPKTDSRNPWQMRKNAFPSDVSLKSVCIHTKLNRTLHNVSANPSPSSQCANSARGWATPAREVGWERLAHRLP